MSLIIGRETPLSTLGVAIGLLEIWHFRQQTALEDILRHLFISGMIFRESHGEGMVEIGSALGSKARYRNSTITSQTNGTKA